MEHVNGCSVDGFCSGHDRSGKGTASVLHQFSNDGIAVVDSVQFHHEQQGAMGVSPIRLLVCSVGEHYPDLFQASTIDVTGD